VLATPAANLDCSTVSPTMTYAIDSENSAVRYRAQEELAGQGANEAVGETNAFIGNIYFDESGLPLACSRFDADLRTLTSDESRRDNFLYNNTLETGTYPLASFILTSVEGLDEPLGEEEVTFTLIGDLTIHGVTKSVSWEATAKLDGDTIAGSAFTTFDMPDFDIEEPVVGPVISVDENVRLEVDITAEVAE
jgi:polyisoprenoid-binding protein YceI